MQTNFSRAQIFNLILLIEALVLVLATAWSHLAGLELLPLLEKAEPLPILAGLIAGVLLSASSILLVLLSRKNKTQATWLSNYLEMVTEVMVPIFSKFRLGDIVLVALASGFCEEVFYRGVLQNQFGLLVASLIFAFCHFAGKKYFFYVIWAGLAGAFFGWGLIITGSLWPPIVAHITNNFLSLAYLRFKFSDHGENQETE